MSENSVESKKGQNNVPAEGDHVAIVSRRLRSLNKKMSKIEKLEQLAENPDTKLNEDQEKTLNSKDSVKSLVEELSIMKEKLIEISQEEEKMRNREIDVCGDESEKSDCIAKDLGDDALKLVKDLVNEVAFGPYWRGRKLARAVSTKSESEVFEEKPMETVLELLTRTNSIINPRSVRNTRGKSKNKKDANLQVSSQSEKAAEGEADIAVEGADTTPEEGEGASTEKPADPAAGASTPPEDGQKAPAPVGAGGKVVEEEKEEVTEGGKEKTEDQVEPVQKQGTEGDKGGEGNQKPKRRRNRQRKDKKLVAGGEGEAKGNQGTSSPANANDEGAADNGGFQPVRGGKNRRGNARRGGGDRRRQHHGERGDTKGERDTEKQGEASGGDNVRGRRRRNRNKKVQGGKQLHGSSYDRFSGKKQHAPTKKAGEGVQRKGSANGGGKAKAQGSSE